MHRFFVIILALITFGANAETRTITWLNEDNTINQTTTCEYGGDLILPAAPTKRGYTFVGWAKGYTPIKYIESTGTQWIDTGWAAPSGYKAEMKILINTYQNGDLYGIIGSHNERAPWGRNYLILDKSNFQIGADGFQNVGSAQTGIEYNISLSTVPDDVYFNDVNVYNLTGSDRSSNNLYLFNVSGYTFNKFIGRMYYLKIWNPRDVLVRDMIPVLDLNDVPCMYDKVTDQYFYNVGTGDFIAGPEANE